VETKQNIQVRVSGMQAKSTASAGSLIGNHNETQGPGLRVKSSVKAGDWGLTVNHNETQASRVRIKSSVKAGSWANHNETQACGLRVKSAVRAGALVDFF
jgi:hypothetical protein